MDFRFTEEQMMMKETASRMARNQFAPRAASIDEEELFPWENVAILRENGLFGVFVPEEYGGVGEGMVTYALIIEEVAKVCATTSTLLATQALPMLVLMFAANDDQKAQWLTPLARGEALAAMAATEPGAGSDLGSIVTTAIRVGDSYILNGRKVFISNGGTADHILALVSTDKSRKTKGLTFLVVDRDTAGLATGKKEKKLGLRGSDTTELIFEDCEVRAKNRIGEEGDGFKLLIKGFNYSRPGIGSQAVGIAQGALELALNYTQQRVQFNQSIASFQGIQWMLADMAGPIEAARSLVYRACAMIDRDPTNPLIPLLSSMAKVFASDTAMKVTTDAVQLLGGYGYCRDFPAERMMRDAKITQIYEGTNQIQRKVIAGHLLAHTCVA